MAMDEDKIKLLLELQGFSDVDEAIASLKHMKGATVDAQAALDATGKASGKAGQALDGAAKSTVNMGQAALQGGRALQDFTQGGIGGILNNIEGVSMALGGGAGLAGVLTAVGIGVMLFGDKIRDFLVGPTAQAATEVERLKKKIEELDGKTVKLTADYSQIEAARERVTEIERALKAVEELNQKRAPIQEEVGKRVGQMLPGGPEMTQNLVDAAARRFNESTPEFQQIQAERAKLQKQIGEIRELAKAGQADLGALTEMANLQGTMEALNQRQAALGRANVEKAKTEVGGALDSAKKGDETGRANLAQQLRGIGEDELADRIMAMTPTKILGERMGKVFEKFTAKVGEAVEKEQGAQKEAGEAIGAMTEAELQRQAEQARRKQEREKELADRARDQREGGDERERQQAGQRAAGNILRDPQFSAGAELVAGQIRQSGMAPEAQMAAMTNAVRQRVAAVPGVPVNATAEAIARRAFDAVDAVSQQLAVSGQQAELMNMLTARVQQLQMQAGRLMGEQARVGSRLIANDNQMPPIGFGWPN